MDRVITRAPYNVRCSYSAKQLGILLLHTDYGATCYAAETDIHIAKTLAMRY